MNQPRTLHEYLQLRNLQRRKQFYLINDEKKIPNALSLDKERKIDQLTIQILNFVKTLIGEGPLYQKFRFMMQHLVKTFQRELSEFHSTSVASKIKSDHKYIDEVKHANQKLNNYLKQCQKDKNLTQQKLEKLVKQNKQAGTGALKIKQKDAPQQFQDNFDDQEVIIKPNDPLKGGKIDLFGDPSSRSYSANRIQTKPTLLRIGQIKK